MSIARHKFPPLGQGRIKHKMFNNEQLRLLLPNMNILAKTKREVELLIQLATPIHAPSQTTVSIQFL